MTEEEYKKEWLNGQHQTDYNNCRFCEDKTKYAIEWIKKFQPNTNIEDPQNLVDRICNYKIYDKDPRKSRWSDKIGANYMLHEMDLDDLIIEPIRISRCYLTQHDYDELPNGKYIVKCNHGSGWNIKFEKKPGFNPNFMMSKIKEWYSLNYAYIAGYEWQYENIVPGIIIQPDYGELLDWSFWCENGKIEGVGLTKKYGKNFEEYLAFVDENGNESPWRIGLKPEMKNLSPRQKEILEKMKPYAIKLAQDFKFVRVDLYWINNTVKFGELTFSPCGGLLELS